MSVKRKYYPIADAAKMIGCIEADLIHLGANSKLEIWALFSNPVSTKRDDLLDAEFGGPNKCYGVGPFLLDVYDLQKLESENQTWCETIWEKKPDCSYAFKLETLYYPDGGFKIQHPSSLIVMATDIERLSAVGSKTDAPLESVSQASHRDLETEGITVALPHMNKALEAIFKVMWENWKDTDPRRMPKQINIARELDAALGYNSEKDSTPSRNAKAIAAIIKPDNLNDTE